MNDGARLVGRPSSSDCRGLDRAAGGGRYGLEGRTGECPGDVPLTRDSYNGNERVRDIGGAEGVVEAEDARR